jgi:hypothetical protein
LGRGRVGGGAAAPLGLLEAQVDELPVGGVARQLLHVGLAQEAERLAVELLEVVPIGAHPDAVQELHDAV